MTAEIAVLNTSAVALAADSAVSIGDQFGTKKVYNSATKLFALSKRHPVGVMLYSNAEIAGRPWETVLKEFRSSLGEEELPSLVHYRNRLVEFIETNSVLFPSDARSAFVQQRAVMEVRQLLTVLIARVKAESSQPTEYLLKRWFDDIVQLAKPSADFQSARKQFLQHHKADLEEAARQALENLDVFKKTRKALTLALAETFVNPANFVSSTGLVLAGFGGDDMFPRLEAIEIDGISGTGLRWRSRNSVKIDPLRNRASVVPFAQMDMARMFMEGIRPDFESAVMGAVRTILDRVPDVMGALPLTLTTPHKTALEQAMVAAFSAFRSEYENEKQRLSTDPLLGVVRLLPRDELAALAETLIDLTSFRRRMTLTAETVGGPVDVAVISKGDGFVWIRRKHYFPPELNHAYFQNYFLDCSES